MRVSKFALLLAVAVSITPNLCPAQSSAVENGELPKVPAASPVNNSVVSVQELSMAGKAETDFKKGTELFQKGDARGSVVYFEHALAKDPSYYRAYHNLGLALSKLGENEQAEGAFRRAIDLTNGGFAPSQFALGVLLLEKGQFPQAEALIERGLSMDPSSPLGKYFLALAQLALNRLSEAEQSARDALRAPNQADAHILLAKIHERSHNPYAVEADVAAYFEVDPHGPLAHEANLLLQRAQNDIERIGDVRH